MQYSPSSLTASLMPAFLSRPTTLYPFPIRGTSIPISEGHTCLSITYANAEAGHTNQNTQRSAYRKADPVSIAMQLKMRKTCLLIRRDLLQRGYTSHHDRHNANATFNQNIASIGSGPQAAHWPAQSPEIHRHDDCPHSALTYRLADRASHIHRHIALESGS